MPQTATGTDFTKSIALNLAGDTPHVIDYAFWTRGPDPTDDWVEIARGSTPPTGVFNISFSTREYGQLYYVIGLGSYVQDVFRVALTFAQNGKTLNGGTVIWSGTADAKGNAAKQDWVNFE